MQVHRVRYIGPQECGSIHCLELAPLQGNVVRNVTLKSHNIPEGNTNMLLEGYVITLLIKTYLFTTKLHISINHHILKSSWLNRKRN